MFLSSFVILDLDACTVGSNDLIFRDGRVDGPYATLGQTRPPTSSLDLSWTKGHSCAWTENMQMRAA